MHMTKGLYEKRPVVRQGWQKIECRKVNPLSWASQDYPGGRFGTGCLRGGEDLARVTPCKSKAPAGGRRACQGFPPGKVTCQTSGPLDHAQEDLQN